MKLELEIQWLERIKQWIFLFKFDKRAHLVLVDLSKEHDDFSYKLESKQKTIIKGELHGFPVKIFSNGILSHGTASVTEGYIDNNKLFILNTYSTYLISIALRWLPSSKKSKLFRQQQHVNILIGSQVVTLKDLLELYMRSQSKHAYMTFLDKCVRI